MAQDRDRPGSLGRSGGEPKRGEPKRGDPKRGDPQGRDPRNGDAHSRNRSRRPAAAQRRSAGRDDQEPAPPEDADVSVLGEDIRAELRGLSPDNADRVGRHLIAAGELLEEDPGLALAHARAARRTAARLPSVREAVGLAAYLAGEWQEALTELRAVRRMSGDSTHLPLLADCERGLGRPDRALALARSPEAAGLDVAGTVELRIVEAGARRDLGQLEAALVVLQDAGLDEADPQEWTLRLWYAFADTLAAAGRPEEARHWFERVVAADEDEQTDARDRLADLPG